MDDNNKELEHKDSEISSETPIQGQHDDFSFMKEKIKERPINRKKLLRRTLITGSMAGVFGLVACFTFLVLEPVFSNWLYPEEDPQVVIFPEEQDETLPEDMLQEEEPASEQNSDDQITTIVEKVELELGDYEILYDKFKEVADTVDKSMVKVIGVNSETDWFNNSYESVGQSSGLIVANNGQELLILVNQESVKKVEKIKVTFCDNTQRDATLKASDASTGLAIISISLDEIAPTTLDTISVAELGSSNAESLIGSPIIAVGSPAGYIDSVSYGIITSIGNPLNMVDINYELLTTDIYGSTLPTGVVVNLSGQIVGMINNSYNSEDTKNLLSCIGISELKKTIERLSNDVQRAYVGIYGTDVTTEANTELDVPFGAYVTGIEMDSPAMSSGIQSGDVIVQVGDIVISNFTDFTNSLSNYHPESTVSLVLMRRGQDDYEKMTIDVNLGTLK